MATQISFEDAFEKALAENSELNISAERLAAIHELRTFNKNIFKTAYAKEQAEEATAAFEKMQFIDHVLEAALGEKDALIFSQAMTVRECYNRSTGYVIPAVWCLCGIDPLHLSDDD
jgi:hypothetical protein